MTKKYFLAALTALVILIPMVTLVAQAADPDFGGVAQFRNRWIEQDRLAGPLRPYTWGPGVPGAPTTLSEPYNSSPGGQRRVLYLDKARMEINNPATGQVTTALAVKELVSGSRQDGDTTFTPLAPSQTQVAGDAVSVNPDAPRYASFKNVVTLGNADDKSKPSAIGASINAFIDKAGNVSTISAPESITVGQFEPQTGHNIAKPFVDFENQRGPITDPLSGNTQENQPIYTFQPTPNVFGLAISEPYWVSAKVGGTDRLILVQLFERRVLTYNPNLASNKVEMGNLGQHYYQWRYVETVNTTPTPTPTPTTPSTPVPPSDYTQARANYNKVGDKDPSGGTGKVATYNAGSAIKSSAAVDLDKNLAVLGTTTNGLHGVNITNQTNQFIFKPSGNPAFDSDPLIYNGTIYAGASDGRVYSLDENASGTVLTEKGKTALVGGGAVKGSVAISPDAKQLYYVVGKSVYAVALDNLTNQPWVQTLTTDLTAPALDAAGNIYLGGSDGKVYAFKPNGQQLSPYPVTLSGGAITGVTPSVANGHLYIGTDGGKVYKIKLDTGISAWSTSVDPVVNIDTTLAIADGVVYVGTDAGKVHRLNDGNGSVLETFPSPVTAVGPVKSSPAVVGQFYYFGDNAGTVYRVDKGLASNKTTLLSGAASFGTNSPVVAGNRLFLASTAGIFYIVS